MPTSLTYVSASARGFEPRRPDAVMSTARREGVARSGFQGGSSAHRTPLKVRRFANDQALSPHDAIPGRSRCQTEKRTLPEADAPVPELGARRRLPPRPREGILTLSPFGVRRETRAFVTALACTLGPPYPCPIAVHMEPFSTSVFKVLI
eukprot:TRINITY_DN193_c14_g1_i3.p4 TRINITY_DN193_c14_g1~~TRINITY_DN193_c14_g1_i3.p4  ORF type:complete len:150 (+),score=7.23 TRINITY_DN193_c14_g1_i3:1476-1925(+)